MFEQIVQDKRLRASAMNPPLSLSLSHTYVCRRAYIDEYESGRCGEATLHASSFLSSDRFNPRPLFLFKLRLLSVRTLGTGFGMVGRFVEPVAREKFFKTLISETTLLDALRFEFGALPFTAGSPPFFSKACGHQRLVARYL